MQVYAILIWKMGIHYLLFSMDMEDLKLVILLKISSRPLFCQILFISKVNTKKPFKKHSRKLMNTWEPMKVKNSSSFFLIYVKIKMVSFKQKKWDLVSLWDLLQTFYLLHHAYWWLQIVVIQDLFWEEKIKQYRFHLTTNLMI